MAVHKQNRNGIWYARGVQKAPDGRRVQVRESLGIKVAPGSGKYADAAIQRIVRAILEGEGSADATAATVAEAVQLYTRRLDPPGRTALGIAQSWARASGDRKLTDLIVAEIEAFAALAPRLAKRGRKAQVSTFATRLTILRAVLNEASRHGLVVPKLDLRIRHPRSYAPKWMPLDERDRLLAHLDPSWRPFVTVMFYTGARPVELGRARWRDLLASTGDVRARILLRDRKGRPADWVERAVQLHPVALAALPEPGRPDDFVFADALGRPLVEATERQEFTAQARHQLRKAFAAAVEGAGLAHMTPYWRRHTFASRIVQQTGNLKAAADLLGHTSLAMVSRHYGRLAEENYDKAITVQALAVGKPTRKRSS